MGNLEERQYKSKVLNQPISTANSKLRKILLFKYVKIAREDTCYRCENRIETLEEFSIEHKKAWLHSDSPVELFFDTNNIAFSHRVCNSAASKQYKDNVSPNKGKSSLRRILPPKGMAWCRPAQKFKPIEEFGKDQYRWNGLKDECRACRSIRRKARYKAGKSR